ncbi:MAG TPA: Dyp-type peroxidase [Bacteroidia bacterium]|nr:Dyp-type peroxidase [Bacteroidia bacterium]
MYHINSQDRKDIQGLLVYGYAQLRSAYFIIFKIENVIGFKSWLSKTTFHDSGKGPEGSCLNIAFTAKGLEKLVGDKSKITKEAGFDQSFLEGMDTDNRNRILGDYDYNNPANWKWGNRNDETHGVLMIYAADDNLRDQVYKTESEKFQEALSEKYKSKSVRLNNDKEHFGFADGISQPVLRGLERKSNENNLINPGEIILGHLNAYDKRPLSPKIDGCDFGKNGSYMVMRDMQQDVKSFWKTLMKYGEDPIRIASKMLGRWPNGIPLSMAETEAEAINLKQEKEKKLSRGKLTAFLNDFQYYENDKDGLKCPMGSHVRRGNPKDTKNEDPKHPNEVSNKHRILRRGKSYGKPLAESMEIKDLIAAIDKPDNEERGLNFICFNSDIKRQFEFIQQTWMNNMKFAGLYDEVDPFVGVQGKYDKQADAFKMLPTKFSEPACPVRHKYNDIPPFVKVRAGGYFFFPGISAIKFLAE